jgi:hypothetical protein
MAVGEEDDACGPKPNFPICGSPPDLNMPGLNMSGTGFPDKGSPDKGQPNSDNAFVDALGLDPEVADFLKSVFPDLS